MGYLGNNMVKVPPNLVKNPQYVLLYENEIHISVSFHMRYGPNTLNIVVINRYKFILFFFISHIVYHTVNPSLHSNISNINL